MHDALDPALVLRLEGKNDPAVALGRQRGLPVSPVGVLLQEAAHGPVRVLPVPADALSDGGQLGDLLLTHLPFMIDDAKDPFRQRGEVGDLLGDPRE